MRKELVFALKLAIYMGVPVLVSLVLLVGIVALGVDVNDAAPFVGVLLVFLELAMCFVAVSREM